MSELLAGKIAPFNRRRFQFSLRTALILFAVVSVPLAVGVWFRDRALRQSHVVEALREQRVFAGYECDAPEFSQWRKLVGERLGSRDYLESIVGVNASLYHRAGFIRKGKPIPLGDAPKFWEQVYLLPRLQGLVIVDDQVTPRSLRGLVESCRLERLQLESTLVGDQHLSEIGRLKELRSLAFGADYFESEEQARISSRGIDPLQSLPKLTYVDLSGTTFNDSCAESLARCQNLESVYLIHTDLSDAGLRCLSTLRSLTTINIGGSRVTRGGSDEFQAAMPHCKVENYVPYDPDD